MLRIVEFIRKEGRRSFSCISNRVFTTGSDFFVRDGHDTVHQAKLEIAQDGTNWDTLCQKRQRSFRPIVLLLGGAIYAAWGRGWSRV